MGQFFDFGGTSLPEIDVPGGGDLLPDLSNAPSTYISNCSVHPFEA